MEKKTRAEWLEDYHNATTAEQEAEFWKNKPNNVRPPSKRRRIQKDCKFEYVDKDGITRTGKGLKFDIDGTEVELFPSGVLVGMLGRSHKTIYNWEENFGFPPSMYRVLHRGQRTRWYSRKQLIAIRTIYEKMGRLKGENKAKLPQFIAAVRAVFFTLDMPPQEAKPREDTSNEQRG